MKSWRIMASDLVSIFGVHLGEIPQLPRHLPLVEVPLVWLLHLHHFRLHWPLCGDWEAESTHDLTTVHCQVKTSFQVFFCASGTNGANMKGMVIGISVMVYLSDGQNMMLLGYSVSYYPTSTYFKDVNVAQRSLWRWWLLLPVAQRKQFFFFFPALHTLTMLRSRSSFGVKMSLWSACLMAVIFAKLFTVSGIHEILNKAICKQWCREKQYLSAWLYTSS